ncbi:MAG: TIGR00266 family protein [Myxococcales bacterium]|nr:TIGR00266 family protein [Myxococcales bacterium]
MQTEIRHNPDFAIIRVQFDMAGEQIVTESGAMVARDTSMQMQTSMRGGLGAALKRKLLGGESIFQNSFTASSGGQTLWIAPAAEGAIQEIDLAPGQEFFLQSGAYLASTPGIQLDTKWQGAKGFFSGGLFLLRAFGEGRLWFSTYGAIHAVDLGQQYQGYICDNTHMVAFTQGLSYSINKVGGLKSLFLSGEGLVCTFQGQGRVWMQSRNPGGLAAFLHPFRRVQSSN